MRMRMLCMRMYMGVGMCICMRMGVGMGICMGRPRL